MRSDFWRVEPHGRQWQENLEATEENEQGWVDLTNQIGNMTLFPKSNNYYMGDNIPGKPRQTVFFLGGFPMYREQCEAALTRFERLRSGLAFAVNLRRWNWATRN